MTDRTDLPERRSIFGELKRRNVFRAAAIYIAAVWALAQGISQLSPAFGAPDWVTRWFVIACAIGFPVWVAFAWYYELTPEGLKRESEVDRTRSITHRTGRKLDFMIIGVMAIAIVLLVTNQFVARRDATTTANAVDRKALAAQFAKIPFRSVAVLPLTNESGDAKQQYFSDGLSEALISDLTQINGLKVIGWHSSFKFRNSQDSPAQIGLALGVLHLVQGSVFQQGNLIRVTVSLISAKDGSSIWSHSYDEQLKDVFAIQAKIGRAVADALRVKLLGKSIAAGDKPVNGNVQAYELMLQGRAVFQRGTESAIRQGITLFRRALQVDPTYAYAWGMLSNASINFGVLYLTGDARQQAFAQARAAVNREQILAPAAAHTFVDNGYLLASVDNDPAGALADYKRAVALAPNDIACMNHLAGGLMNFGQLQEAAAIYRKILVTDPLRVDVYYSLALAELGGLHLDAAQQTLTKALQQQSDFPGLRVAQVEIDVLRGDTNAAASEAAGITDPVNGPWARALARQAGPDRKRADAALRDFIAKEGKNNPYLVADLYALRKQPNDMFDWLQRAWKQQDPAFIPSLLSDPFVLAYKDDPRFAALCKQAGLPVPGSRAPAGIAEARGPFRS
ncbi:MAG TPA: hypothetical protein VF292_04385 [Rhodanobacteraceae bacterium]